MNRPPAFQLYPTVVLSDEVIQGMPPTAVGGWFFLECQAWLSSPPCTLPDDDAALARLSRLGDQWPQHAAVIRNRFIARGGRLFSKLLRPYYLELMKYRRERSKSGQKGAHRRWQTDGVANGSAVHSPMASDGTAPATVAGSSTSSNGLKPPVGPEIEAFVNLFRQKQAERLGEESPGFSGSKAKTVYETLRQTHSHQEIGHRLDVFFRSTDPFIEKRCFCVDDFVKHFGALKRGPICAGARPNGQNSARRPNLDEMPIEEANKYDRVDHGRAGTQGS